MNNSNKKLNITALFSVALAVLAAAFLALSGLYEFDADMGYFKSGSLYSAALYCVMALGVILGIWALVSFRKSACASRALPYCKFLSVICVLCGAAILVSVFTDVIAAMDRTITDNYIIVNYISWGLGVLAAISLFFSAYQGNGEPAALPCFMAFFPPLYFAAKVLVNYFDRTVAVNSPIAMLCQVTFIAVMLSFTAEAGIMLGRQKLFSRYLFTLCTSAVFGIGIGCGAVICFFTGTDILIGIYDAVIFIIFGIYSAVRLFSVSSFDVISAESLPAQVSEESESEDSFETLADDITDKNEEE